MVWEDFAWSWSEFRQFNADWFRQGSGYVHYDRELSSDAEHGRNALVDRFMGEWLLFTDVDHDVAPDLLVRMLNAAAKTEAQVLVGLYQARGAPHHPILYGWADNKFRQLSAIPGDVCRVAAAGAGCLWVKRSVFARIRDEFGEGPFSRRDGYSEDLSFFLRLAKLEIPVICDPRLLHPHLRVRAVVPADLQVAG